MVLAVGASYRMDRVTSFLHPSSDLQGNGWQYSQSMRALADGGFFGKGLGEGASKWGYLPNLHTDFIFALIGEELGFVGCIAVLGLFALLAWTGLRIAARSSDPWIRLVAGTLTAWQVAQAAENIGYVVGVLPVTGVTLPLISYGGTSVVITMVVFGLLANCARHEPQAVSALRSQGPGTFGTLLKLPAPAVYQPPARRKPPKPSTPPRGQQRSRPTAARAPRSVAARANPSTDYRRARTAQAGYDNGRRYPRAPGGRR